MSDHNIRPLAMTDVEAIANIHIASFHDRALSQLGKSTVRRYYAWLLTGFKHAYPICAVNASGAIEGFCFAGIYGGSFSGFLQRNKWHLVGRILLRPWLLFNPIIREQLRFTSKVILRNMRNKRRIKHVVQKALETAQPKPSQKMLGILAIAVDPCYQRQGVGEALMTHVEGLALANGYHKLNLSVHPYNIPAVKFYQQQGWQKVVTGESWQGQMSKDIA